MRSYNRNDIQHQTASISVICRTYKRLFKCIHVCSPTLTELQHATYSFVISRCQTVIVKYMAKVSLTVIVYHRRLK